MKTSACTTTTFVNETNSAVSFTVEKTAKQFVFSDYNTTLDVTAAITLYIHGKKLSLPITREIFGQLESLCCEMRYYANVISEEEAQQEAVSNRERWVNYQQEKAEKAAAERAALEAAAEAAALAIVEAEA